MTFRKIRAAARAALFLLLTVTIVALYPVAIALGMRVRRFMRRIWCVGTCRIINLQITRTGQAFRACPTLVVANHVSYLDIVALGSFVDATFIAKSEIRGWPLLGFVANCVGTMFIRRHWRQALIQRNALAARMRLGESFVLFAEGTSTSGLAVKPFKTSLLSVAEPWVLDCPVAVQGATLAYTRLADGRPFDRTTCDLFAWYDDMPFVPHLWAMLHEDGCAVTVRLHEPVLSWAVESRKRLGAELRAEIVGSLARARQTIRPVVADDITPLEPASGLQR